MKNRILELLLSIHPDYDYANSNNYIEDGLLDSYDMMVLITELEDSYNIMIDPVEIIPENFANLEALCTLITNYKDN